MRYYVAFALEMFFSFEFKLRANRMFVHLQRFCNEHILFLVLKCVRRLGDIFLMYFFFFGLSFFIISNALLIFQTARYFKHLCYGTRANHSTVMCGTFSDAAARWINKRARVNATGTPKHIEKHLHILQMALNDRLQTKTKPI